MGNTKSYWIWHYGEFEIYHSMRVNLLREEAGVDYPTFWHVDSPYVSVILKKEFECTTEGYFKAFSTGTGMLVIDDKRHPLGKEIRVAPGKHKVEAWIFNMNGGLPAVYIESDICPSDGTWLSNHCIKSDHLVGWREEYDSPEKSPEVFMFSYEHREPVSTELVDGGLLVDFGQEYFGYLNVENADPEEEFGVFYGESREEALETDISILFEHLKGDTKYCLRQRALRYIFVKAKDEAMLSKLKISMEYEYIPFEKKGDFKCDNELFNRLYDACVHTFHLNCRENFLDGIKRDRWVWSGDAYQSARINSYLFADEDIVRRTAIGLAGKPPIEQHINTIIDYTFLWMIGLHEHYMTYGDIDFIKRIYPMAVKFMDFCENRLNEDGFIIQVNLDWTFVDWTEYDKTGAVCAEQMLFIKACEVMAELAQVAGDDGKRYFEKSVDLKKKVSEYYWNEELGAFIDSYESGKNNVTRHANIFAIMYDIATPEQAKSIVENVLRNDNIIKITTPYFKGYELDVLGKLGDISAIENELNSYYGAMLNEGATTIWEEYDPTLKGIEHYAMYGEKFGKSLCHAWGAGPIYLFGRYYLGVYPTSPAYATFNVEPNLGSLNEMNGKVPVNGGCVEIHFDKKHLCVLADKAGGTLIWKGEKYELVPNEKLVLDC